MHSFLEQALNRTRNAEDGSRGESDPTIHSVSATPTGTSFKASTLAMT